MEVELNEIPKIKKTSDMKKYRNEYYANHKEKFLRWHEQPYYCEICKKDIRRSSKRNHEKSEKHHLFKLAKKQSDDWHIVTKIGNEEYTLNKIGAPTYLQSIEIPEFQKSHLMGYVRSQFRDIVNESSDIKDIKYMNGDKIVFHFTY